MKNVIYLLKYALTTNISGFVKLAINEQGSFWIENYQRVYKETHLNLKE